MTLIERHTFYFFNTTDKRVSGTLANSPPLYPFPLKDQVSSAAKSETRGTSKISRV